MKSCFGAVLCLAFAFASGVRADPTPKLDYQGKILVGDIPLTGPGYFKYAIANESGTTNFWSHDGSTVGEPTTFITNECFNGVFSTILGSAPMTGIDPNIFAPGTGLQLRVWFSEDKVTFNEMLPAQALVSAPFAMNTHMVDGLHAADIIARATNAVTLSGDVSGTPGGGTTVDSLQGDALSIGAAAAGEVLTWDGSAWTNAPGGGGGGDITAVTGTNGITGGGLGGAVVLEAYPPFFSGLYVNVSGDTMTGILNINSSRGLTIGSASNEVEIGNLANAARSGTAVGTGAQAYSNGTAIGLGSRGFSYGAALGESANGASSGAAVGVLAYGYSMGVAVGYSAKGGDLGAGVGYQANGSTRGVAVGYSALGMEDAVAVGMNSVAITSGVAVGHGAYAPNYGVAVGRSTLADTEGTALGYSARGTNSGAAVGYAANGNDRGVAVGRSARGPNRGIGIGYQANGSDTNIAIGSLADAGSGRNSIAIGQSVNNAIPESARIRGTLYMDGGTALVARSTFGAGAWRTLVPLPPLDNVIWVATNGTPMGPGTVDRPYDNPQAGYMAAGIVYPGQPATVVICGGKYSTGLTMNFGHIHVFGLDRAEIAGLTVSATSVGLTGKQRVENIVFTAPAIVSVDSGDVKFNNCRFQSGLLINGSNVEVMNCFATAGDGNAIALGGGFAVNRVAIYNTAAELDNIILATVQVGIGVQNFEMIGCHIVNIGGGPAILDFETPGPIDPLHLYAHNYIKGPSPAGGPAATPAVLDPGNTTNTIAFYQNVVFGHVGNLTSQQLHANNTLQGLMLWAQGGVGIPMDAYGNVQFTASFNNLPASWRD